MLANCVISCKHFPLAASILLSSLNSQLCFARTDRSKISKTEAPSSAMAVRLCAPSTWFCFLRTKLCRTLEREFLTGVRGVKSVRPAATFECYFSEKPSYSCVVKTMFFCSISFDGNRLLAVDSSCSILNQICTLGDLLV